MEDFFAKSAHKKIIMTINDTSDKQTLSEKGSMIQKRHNVSVPG